LSALSRTKGASFERFIANKLTESTGTLWRRRVRNHQGDSDLVSDDPAMSHIVIECKHANTLRLPEWWRQAQDQAYRRIPPLVIDHGAARQSLPVLVYRQTRGPIQIMLDAHHVNPAHWPVAGRYTVTLDWDAAMQWLREKLPATFSPEVI